MCPMLPQFSKIKVQNSVPGCLSVYAGFNAESQLIVQANLHPPSQCLIALLFRIVVDSYGD